MELLNSLNANMSTDIRPGLDDSIPLMVNISYNLVALTELNEVKGYIATVGFLYISWMDDRVTWNSSEYEGVSSVSVDSSKVWTPEILIGNPADTIYQFDDVKTVVRYTSNGLALWTPGIVAKTTCFIQIPAYPFDVHTCEINLIAWGTVPSEVILQRTSTTVNTLFYYKNAEWTLTQTSVEPRIMGNELSMTVVYLEYSRKSAFLVVNVLIPIVFLSVLNSMVFLLPQESGERVSFSITVLLSFTVFLTVIGDNIPKTSSPMPYLCSYVIVALITSGLIALATILCLRLYHTSGRKPVPRWLMKCFRMSTSVSPKVLDSVPVNEDKKVPAPEESISSTENTWEQVILKLDKILFLFFFILAIAIALGFIISMANMQS